MSFEKKKAEDLIISDRIVHANLGKGVWIVQTSFTSGKNTKLELRSEDYSRTLSITFHKDEKVQVEC